MASGAITLVPGEISGHSNLGLTRHERTKSLGPLRIGRGSGPDSKTAEYNLFRRPLHTVAGLIRLPEVFVKILRGLFHP
jgi:hypothetical protein